MNLGESNGRAKVRKTRSHLPESNWRPTVYESQVIRESVGVSVENGNSIIRVPVERWESPFRPEEEGHLYVLEIVGACTKVGITSKPWSRLKTHEQLARCFRRSIGRVWLTRPHVEACSNERILCSGNSNEYLDDAFDDVVARAESLPMTRYANSLRPFAPWSYSSWAAFAREWSSVKGYWEPLRTSPVASAKRAT